MRAFAALLDRLVLTPQRTVKLRLMTDYFRETPDPDRGFALAALTGDLDIPSVKPAMLRAMVTARVDEVLFAYSYDYVGDLAETIALIWPGPEASAPGAAPLSPLAGETARLGEAKPSLAEPERGHGIADHRASTPLPGPPPQGGGGLYRQCMISPVSRRLSSGYRRHRGARGRGWWKAGSINSTPPGAGR